MNPVQIGERDLVAFVKPDTVVGAFVYALLFVLAALVLSRALRAAVHAAMTREGHIDRTTISFLQQIGSATIWVIVVILYAHLIPELRSIGTAMLAGASIASVVIGLAAQSTLGNLVAGVSITLYRPFRLGDTLQVAAPAGADIGVVELISLGYTTLRTADGRLIVLPNSLAASQVTVNLSSAGSAGAFGITVHLENSADVEAARRLALEVAAEQLGAQGVIGCFLTKVDASGITLELRVAPGQAGGRDEQRSNLMASLATRFRESGLGSKGAASPAFS